MGDSEVHYVSDENGETTAVIVPISLWHEIQSERETQYLLKSENMRRRLLEAMNREEGIPLDEVIRRLGL
jgi:PHD/YefM family antitoxin component YafN of YafNO toxin-antitoxin module